MCVRLDGEIGVAVYLNKNQKKNKMQDLDRYTGPSCNFFSQIRSRNEV